LDPESADVVLLMLAERVLLPLVLLDSMEFSKRGFREAITIGAVLAIAVGFDMA
jgi:hypothetical protein